MQARGENVAKAGNALISVYDKAGIENFARDLSKLGWNIYASGNTAKTIAKAGVQVTDTAELTKGESILGHRVVTLSREIYAGILASDSQLDELKSLGLPRIDLVCVDMYPLEKAIAEGKSEEYIIEQTDVGGPSLLHAAAKGRRIVLSKPEHRQAVIEWLKRSMPDATNFKRKLAAAAELEVAKYLLTSAKYLNQDDIASFIGTKEAGFNSGENPWQLNAALYAANHEDPLAINKFNLRQGTNPSWNNYAELDRMLQTATHIAAGFDKNYGRVPAIALGAKHGNVCGAAVNTDPKQTVRKMLDGDPRAIFGGSVFFNFKITKEIAELILKYGVKSGRRLLYVLAAPEFSNDALKLLEHKKGRMRVFINPNLAKLDKTTLDNTRRFRYVRGGTLFQDNYTKILNFKSKELIQHSGKKSTKSKGDLILAWAVGSTSNSNTVTVVKDDMLIGNGVGQQDRISAAELAVKRANDSNHEINGAVAYSDSFFPFPDGPAVLIKAGVGAILASRGSVKDELVFEAMKESGIAFYTLPDETIRGFYAH